MPKHRGGGRGGRGGRGGSCVAHPAEDLPHEETEETTEASGTASTTPSHAPETTESTTTTTTPTGTSTTTVTSAAATTTAAAAEEGESAAAEETAGSKAQKDPRFPLTVNYCTVCGLPCEYCDFGPCPAQCKAANLQAPSDAVSTPAPESGGGSTTTTTAASTPEGEDPATTGRKRGGKGSPKPLEPATSSEPKLMPGGKIKKKDPGKVTLIKTSRSKRKYITAVCGLDTFPGIKLADASKVFAKTFACGSAVVKTSPGSTHEQVIEVQGDVTVDLRDLLVKKWAIPADAISIQEKS
ncbi:Translation initiation factor SUI1 [Pelomyxa schiedti]|nr:Translation initiation factor SUI1 [Pelomyxa schiedti]